jgi:hypothetical protein
MSHYTTPASSPSGGGARDSLIERVMSLQASLDQGNTWACARDSLIERVMSQSQSRVEPGIALVRETPCSKLRSSNSKCGDVLVDDEKRTRIEAADFDPETQERISELADKCNEGLLSDAERAEYENLVQSIHFLGMLHRHAGRRAVEGTTNRRAVAFPPGWDEKRVQDLLAELDSRTDDEWVAEDDASAEKLAD